MVKEIINRKVAVRVCREYDYNEVYNLASEIYDFCEGPEVCQYHAVEIRRKIVGE